MITCITPSYKNISSLCENSNKSDIPVIVIVKSSWAKEVALSQFRDGGYEPIEEKLTSIRDWMVDGAILYPSIMQVSFGGKPQFGQGRTRALVAHEKGFHDYPIVTTERHALAFKDYWGSIANAKQHFDFSECWDDVDKATILGNP